MAYKFNDAELTSEKSLWDVYVLSRRIRPSKLQSAIFVIAIILLTTNAFYLQSKPEALLSDVHSWASTGFNFSISTLGFLISGFTIFATLSKPKMMLAMMEHQNKETGLPTLKYNFFAFMKIFIAYIGYSGLYLSIILFGQSSGFLSNTIELLPYGQIIKILLIKIAYIIVGSSFVHLLLLLKSFVFNIYSIVMNFLRWEYHQE